MICFKYIGIDIMNREINRITMEQSQYIKEKVRIPLAVQVKHERVLSEREQERYKSVVGQLNWLAQNTRPDLCFAVSKLGRKLVKATNRDLKQLRTEVVRLKEEECQVVIT